MMMNDELYMLRCIKLAQLGKRAVAPNPMVGAIIVHDNKIIGEGYHQHYGEAHAEVNAINSVLDKSLLKDATIFVSLEPCAHHGKTPPCSDLLITNKFKRVVIGCLDTYSEVSGKGIEKLQKAGIDVTVGILEKECRELNKRFFTFHEKKRPYIILKWAQTQDGYIDINRANNEKGINWITQKETKSLVHQWRSEEHAILVGKKTIFNDNPSLSVREVKGINPVRVVIDSTNSTFNSDYNIFNQEAPTIIFNSKLELAKNNINWIKLQDYSIKNICDQLYKLNIQSIIIEGGAYTLNQFISSDFWDEARVLIGQSNFEAGLKAPRINFTPLHSETFFDDKIHYYKNQNTTL